MSTLIKLGDTFMQIPKLDETGGSWVIYKDRFLWSIDACSYLEHVAGTSVAPGDPVMCTDASQVFAKSSQLPRLRSTLNGRRV